MTTQMTQLKEPYNWNKAAKIIVINSLNLAANATLAGGALFYNKFVPANIKGQALLEQPLVQSVFQYVFPVVLPIIAAASLYGICWQTLNMVKEGKRLAKLVPPATPAPQP